MKNRLIGILMLLVLASIIWPILFSEDAENTVDMTSRIAGDTEYVERFKIDPPEHDLFKESDIQKAEAILVGEDEPDTEEAQKKIDVVTQVFKEKKAPSYAESPVTESKMANAVSVNKDKRRSTKKITVVDKSPVSWVIQVASFINYDNAEDLVKRLKVAGYKAYIEKANTQKGQRVRVFVGPNLDRNVVERWKKEINKQFKVSAIVSRFKA